MSFGAATWLWGLALLPLFALALWLFERRQNRRALRFYGPQLAARQIFAGAAWMSWARLTLLVVGAAGALLALSRPQWGASQEEIHVKGLDLAIALDLSNSMEAEDVAPSRLAVARSVARELSRLLPGDRIGLIGFAGKAAPLCPLTLDRSALELYLDAAEPRLFPAQGTDLGGAIRAATSMFERTPQGRRLLVIISDGEDHEAGVIEAVNKAKAAGITIYSIGIGTLQGGPIPERNEHGALSGYHNDKRGQVVTTRLEEQALSAIARDGGGAYFRVSAAGHAAQEAAEQIGKLEREARSEKIEVHQVERYRWPLTAALVAMLIEAALIRPRKEGA